MDIKESLASFYDDQAEKYAQTRNKHWSDADIFLDALTISGKKNISLLEFGCGSGRLLNQLKNLSDITINYTGVDISKKLLAFAKKQVNGKENKHIKATFLCDDIVDIIGNFPQESFDFVIGIASFQHIPTVRERFFLIKNIYRILSYDGELLLSNRSFSSWFLKKYKKTILLSLRNNIISRGKYKWNDLMIPRKNGGLLRKRFYHIYTLRELKKMIILSGFVITKSGYIDKNGEIIDSWKSSKNSLVVGKKSIFLKTGKN